MANTDYTNYGASLDRLNDRQRRFALEYLIDCNGTRAAIAAGYSKKTASVKAAKLLQHKLIKRVIGKSELLSRKRLEATREDVLEQLAYCATRSGADFVDEQGNLIQNINDLPIRAQNAIDGIEHEEFYDAEGTLVKVKRKLKLVPKASAIEMAMRHKGLFAPEKQVIKYNIDLDSLLGKPDVLDNIEVRLIEEAQDGSNEKQS